MTLESIFTIVLGAAPVFVLTAYLFVIFVLKL